MPVIVEGITAPELGIKLGDWVKQNTIAIAEQALQEEVRRGFDTQPVVITDGVPGAIGGRSSRSARSSSRAAPGMADAVLWALQRLEEKSPVLTGRYRASHVVMINGAQIAGDVRTALVNIGPSDRVQIVNTQPYARKIEGATASRRTGRQKRRASSRQAPAGVYRVVVRELVQRFGRTMFFDYKLVKLNLGVKVWGVQGGARGKHPGARQRKRVLRDQIYPALQFFIQARPDAG
jgi:hypothetical protein